MSADILVVDDETDIRELVAGILGDEGHRTRMAGSADEALSAIEARRPNLVFLDIWLQGSRLDGLQVLDQIKESHPDLPVVMISGHGNIETAVSAIKRGAYDFIEKPFKADRLVLVADRALEASRLKREIRDLKTRSGDTTRIAGNSTAVNQLRQTIERVAPTNARVMISGAPGTGKELAARTLHTLSGRSSGPFVALNAAMILPATMEEELFGTEAGEGRSRRVGALEEAHGGTLYLDEVADMPLGTQGKILRVLTEQSFARVGGQRTVRVDVRVLSATARNLHDEIAEGRFREDLYYRLNVLPIRVPPLRERRGDIAALLEVLGEEMALRSGDRQPELAPDALALLAAQTWRGNIRELRNVLEQAVMRSDSLNISRAQFEEVLKDAGIERIAPLPLTDFAGSDLAADPLRPLAQQVAQVERRAIAAAMAATGGNKLAASRLLGISRAKLYERLDNPV